MYICLHSAEVCIRLQGIHRQIIVGYTYHKVYFLAAHAWAAPSENVSSSTDRMYRIRFIPGMHKRSSGHLLYIDAFYSVK